MSEKNKIHFLFAHATLSEDFSFFLRINQHITVKGMCKKSLLYCPEHTIFKVLINCLFQSPTHFKIWKKWPCNYLLNSWLILYVQPHNAVNWFTKLCQCLPSRRRVRSPCAPGSYHWRTAGPCKHMQTYSYTVTQKLEIEYNLFQNYQCIGSNTVTAVFCDDFIFAPCIYWQIQNKRKNFTFIS